MTTLAPPRPPAGALPLSAFDAFHVGMDELGRHVLVDFNDRPGMVIGGEPGSGKSSIVNLITGHGALSRDCKLILIDGKLVELWPWRNCAELFVGPSLPDAAAAFESMQQVINDRLKVLTGMGRRKVTKADGLDAWLIVKESTDVTDIPNLDPRYRGDNDRKRSVGRGQPAGQPRYPGTTQTPHPPASPPRTSAGCRRPRNATCTSTDTPVMGCGRCTSSARRADASTERWRRTSPILTGTSSKTAGSVTMTPRPGCDGGRQRAGSTPGPDPATAPRRRHLPLHRRRPRSGPRHHP
jgi:hypothetical protein